MRAGGCTVQQALTAEAASVIKQSVSLARRRGHAQVTPLHVANTMLTASTGLLRTACLQSHSHPLQCKALELCFNVALNRLPASTSSPMLGGGGGHSQYPSISNALVAAFKRAQAHQRRGSIENQQQPLLAVKIELEQLIISILDDPSVSRVMKEAGFSSTQVKSNVEQVVSLEICSQRQSSPSVSSKKEISNNGNLVLSHHHQSGGHNNIGTKVGTKPNRVLSSDPIRNEDVMYVIENLMKKRRRNVVIVGESITSIEGVVRGVMDKVNKGDVPEALRDVKFVTLSLSSFGHLNRVEVEKKVEEIKNLVRSCNLGRGVVLNLGDLEWADYNRASSSEQGRGYYCSLEHMIMEVGKLVSGIGDNTRFWLLGFATFQTYMRCESGYPSLETTWALHPLTIPAGTLRLSLITNSTHHSTSKRTENGSSWLLQLQDREETPLTCCGNCLTKFEAEARSLQSNDTCNTDSTTTSRLPPWLQQYKDESNSTTTSDKDSAVKDLCKKWNSICNSFHKQPCYSETTPTFSSVSPSSSTSGFSFEYQQHPSIVEPKQSWREHQFLMSPTSEPSLTLHPFSTSNPNSNSSSDVMEMEYVSKFKERNVENLTILCAALERKVPWQKNVIPEIASTILNCRSGMVGRKGHSCSSTTEIKEETWLFFQGVDMQAKEKIAKEVARLIFGSDDENNFISIALSSFSSSSTTNTRAADSISTDHHQDINRNKRSRDEQSCSYIERFAEAMSINPHRVFFIDDVEQADYFSHKGFKRAIERGRITNSDGDEVGLSDAIIILSCERACSPPVKQKSDELEETSPSVSLDLNISIDDDDDQSVDDVGLLDSVDKQIVFKTLEL